MPIYHVNPKTGEPGACNAVKGKCPFGSPEEHHSTAEKARKAFEAVQKLQLQGLGKAKNGEIALTNILDVELLNKMIREKFINKNIHPDDDSYVLLCYTVNTQIQGKWNDATKLARGLIIRRGEDDLRDAVVLERPWSKFFTLQQQENGWHLGDEENVSSAEDAFKVLDFNAPADVYDKMDGSLGILYKDPSGLPAFATKGSFTSVQALEYTKLLRQDEARLAAAQALLEKHKDTTAMFELVGPNNRVVLAYDKTDMVLLGGSKKSSGDSVNPEQMKVWSAAGLPTVERMKAATLTEALALPPRENREGVVVSIGGKNPMKIKIKQDDYLRMHRIVTMFSKKESRALVMDLDRETTYADLLAVGESKDVSYFKPIKDVLEVDGFSKDDASYEFIRQRREEYFKEILLPRAEEIKKAKDVIDSLDESYFQGENPQKRFATLVKSLEADQSSLFAFYRARLEGKTPEEMSAFHEIRRAVKNVKDSSD